VKKDESDRAFGLWTWGSSSHLGAIAMVDERPQLDVATFASADLWMKVQLFLVSIGRMICSRC